VAVSTTTVQAGSDHAAANHAYSFGRYFESAGQPVLMSG
jgi:hypothetical protein